MIRHSFHVFSNRCMQEKTSELAAIFSPVGLNVHKGETNSPKVNIASVEQNKLKGNEI